MAGPPVVCPALVRVEFGLRPIRPAAARVGDSFYAKAVVTFDMLTKVVQANKDTWRIDTIDNFRRAPLSSHQKSVECKG
jgi:hypothetical protein